MTTADRSSSEALLRRVGAVLETLLRDLPEETVTAALAADPEAVERRYEAGLVALQAGDYDAAADAFGEAAAARPAVSRYHFALGLCLQQFGSVTEAMEQFATALALDATDAAAAFRLGECFYALGQLDGAREALQMAVQLCDLPENDPPIRLLAETLLDQIARTGA